jgi:antitoxin ParD1/3/4
MGTTRKTITVTVEQDSWIKARISAGEFTNDSEYIRDLIRHDQAGQAELEAIRAALIEAEQSGEPQPFEGDKFKQEMIAKHGGRKG